MPKDLNMQETSPSLYLKGFSGAFGAGWKFRGTNTTEVATSQTEKGFGRLIPSFSPLEGGF